MRTLAIGDVHGCAAALRTLAAAVELRPTDRLVMLGDYVDRGPDSRGVIDWVIAAGKTCAVVALRGNHEVMMLSSRTDDMLVKNWSSFGGYEALESYGTSFNDDWVAAVPESHWRFLESTRNYLETGEHIFVHGSVNGRVGMREQDPYRLIWGRCFENTPHISGKRVVCGHTPQEDGRIGCYEWGVCLDTNCCRDGWLTCLDVMTGDYWQANENGQTRQGRLEVI